MSGFLVTSELKPWGGREAALCAYHSSSNWSRFASPFSVRSIVVEDHNDVFIHQTEIEY